MLFYPHEKLALFVDGISVYGMAKGLGFDIDYRRLHNAFAQKGTLVRSYYYTAITTDDADFKPIKPLIDWLEYNGWTLITKPGREYVNSLGERKVRGDMSVDIAVSMLEICERVDHLVLFSGNIDLCPAVAAVQRRGRRVSVVSSLKTSPPMCADELRRLADSFIEFEELRPLVERTPRT